MANLPSPPLHRDSKTHSLPLWRPSPREVVRWTYPVAPTKAPPVSWGKVPWFLPALGWALSLQSSGVCDCLRHLSLLSHRFCWTQTPAGVQTGLRATGRWPKHLLPFIPRLDLSNRLSVSVSFIYPNQLKHDRPTSEVGRLGSWWKAKKRLGQRDPPLRGSHRPLPSWVGGICDGKLGPLTYAGFLQLSWF